MKTYPQTKNNRKEEKVEVKSTQNQKKKKK